MIAYVVRRVLILVPLLLAVSFIVFLLLRAVPGDPAIAIAGDKAPREVLDRVRRERGFDKPVLVQYGVYLGRLLQGDLGQSYKRSTEKVSTEIAAKLPPTIELALASLLLAIGGGLFFGILSAARKGGWMDYLSMTIALAGVSVPIFWLGLLLILAFGSLLPIGGYHPLEYFPDEATATGFILWDTLWAGDWDTLGSALLHLILPAMTLATVPLSITARITRAAMLEVLESDYIRTARAKGLSSSAVLLRHALRNALIPIVTVVGMEFGYLLGGAVLTETVFDWPGMGTYLLRAVRDTEYDSIGGAILVLCALFVGVNLLVDVLYAFLDPRIRYESKTA